MHLRTRPKQKFVGVMEKVEIKKWVIEIGFELRKLRYELVNQTGPKCIIICFSVCEKLRIKRMKYFVSFTHWEFKGPNISLIYQTWEF